MAGEPTPRARVPAFQPRFTLTLLYLLAFFALVCVLFALPDLLDILARVPAGPEQEQLAREAARKALSGRVAPAFMMALAGVGVCAYYRLLPGLRPR